MNKYCTHIQTARIHISNSHTCTLLEEKVLYRNLKGSFSATYLEPLKGSK